MYPCTRVGIDYFDNAPSLFRAVVEIKATPAQIFSCFEDADSWPQWAPPIQKVEWTSEKPYDVGTTRRVSMTGRLVGDEVFIAWDYPQRMAFCFTHSSQGLIDSFAEDYQVTPLDNGLTRVQWTMGMTPKGIGRLTMKLSGPMMRFGLQWMLNRFKKHVEQRFPG
ncbi:MAG TPA: SRPBCC family protein [Pseudomonadales bacterium]